MFQNIWQSIKNIKYKITQDWQAPIICLFLPGQMEQMFTAFPPDVAGNLDYKNLVHIITHGEEKDQE